MLSDFLFIYVMVALPIRKKSGNDKGQMKIRHAGDKRVFISP